MANKKRLVYVELSALKGRIREKKTSYRELSGKIGRSTNTLYLMLNGYAAPGADDVEAISEELDISPDEVVKYFFPRMLQNAI
jgi:transcriptional regulator with XRE-family HTH domain